MIRQEFYLSEWDWHVVFLYDVDEKDTEAAMLEFRKAGCIGRNMKRAAAVLTKGAVNCGITFTNYKKHSTVAVIGQTTSADEFQDSFDHEKGHICKHICMAYDINPFGEEAEYLAGAIGKLSFPVAKRFLCDHCRLSWQRLRTERLSS